MRAMRVLLVPKPPPVATDVGNTGGSVPKDRKHGVSELHTVVGDDGGGEGRSHQRAVPRRGFPK